MTSREVLEIFKRNPKISTESWILEFGVIKPDGTYKSVSHIPYDTEAEAREELEEPIEYYRELIHSVIRSENTIRIKFKDHVEAGDRVYKIYPLNDYKDYEG